MTGLFMTGLNRILLYPPDSVNYSDTLPYFDFDMEACTARVRRLNPDIRIFPLSAVTGEGCAAWEDWLRGAFRDFR